LGEAERVAGGLLLLAPNGSPQWPQNLALSAEARLHLGQIMRSLPLLNFLKNRAGMHVADQRLRVSGA
jgi:uncharacterized protein YqjF (DUF2071 family)